MNVESKLDGGCERFLNIEVRPTDEAIDFDDTCVDQAGRKHLRGAVPYVAIKGTVSAQWIDESNRWACMEYQKRRKGRKRQNRWDAVEAIAEQLQAGKQIPGPVYLHPSISGTGRYRAIDGARRTMALAESGLSCIPCVVLRRAFDSQP